MNETSVYQRVRILIRHKKFTSNEIAAELKITQQTAWNYLNDKTRMSGEFIERVLGLFPDASAEWVMRGEGRMYHAEHYATATEAEADPAEAARPSAEQPSGQSELVAALRDTIAAKDELIAELKKRCATLEDAEAEKRGVA